MPRRAPTDKEIADASVAYWQHYESVMSSTAEYTEATRAKGRKLWRRLHSLIKRRSALPTPQSSERSEDPTPALPTPRKEV